MAIAEAGRNSAPIMNIYLDDNLNQQRLAAMLRAAGHTVVQPADASLMGATDVVHLEHATRNSLAVLTADRVDFRDLHQLVQTVHGIHFGILVVRYENGPRRDMKARHIVAAIGKLERSGLDLSNQFVILNHWR